MVSTGAASDFRYAIEVTRSAVSYAYSPYGETTALGPDEGNPLQYTGRENDGSGLYYYRARYYDTGLKRFVAQDPIGTEGGVNIYAYVAGDPIGFSDALGLKASDSRYRICPEGTIGKTVCKFCIDVACRFSGTVCCTIEQNACLSDAAGDKEMQDQCRNRFIECLGKNRKLPKEPKIPRDPV